MQFTAVSGGLHEGGSATQIILGLGLSGHQFGRLLQRQPLYYFLNVEVGRHTRLAHLRLRLHDLLLHLRRLLNSLAMVRRTGAQSSCLFGRVVEGLVLPNNIFFLLLHHAANAALLGVGFPALTATVHAFVDALRLAYVGFCS